MAEERSKETLKSEKLRGLCNLYNIDLAGLYENNKDWRQVDQKNTIWNATSTWSENRRVQAANNITKPSNAEFQVGGTAMVAFDDFVFGITKQGSDSRKLGRWVWMTVTGRNNCNTTIITCYCPVKGSSPGSVYSQHLIYMAENNIDVPNDIACPRQLFGYDLKQLIDEKEGLGHQIIIGGDFNSEYKELNDWMLHSNLNDLLKTKHGSGPRTFKRSKDSPIDCFFGSSNIKIRSGGFLSFGRLQSDHRGIWIDIPIRIIMGHKPAPITYFQARRLKLEDPRIRKKYAEYLHKVCASSNYYSRMDTLHRRTVYPLPIDLALEYEQLDEELETYMELAEKIVGNYAQGIYHGPPRTNGFVF